jgi:hypothetical protein
LAEGRFMLWLLYCLPLLLKFFTEEGSCYGWLYCLPLLFKVWQWGGSCCFCYIVYHCCLRFDSGVVHVIVVILSTITFQGMTEDWFMLLVVILSTITVYDLTEELLILLLLYCLPLLFNVWQRGVHDVVVFILSIITA